MGSSDAPNNAFASRDDGDQGSHGNESGDEGHSSIGEGEGKRAAYADPTPMEVEAMENIKAWLARDGLTMPATITSPECGGENRAILKFIRARKSAEKSYEMLTKSLEWRKANGVDTCLDTPCAPAHLKWIAEIPAFWVGYGRSGHPVYLEHTAVIPWDTILQHMTEDEFLVSQVQTLEWQNSVVFPEASRRAGEPITQVINVWDLKGLTLSAFNSKVRAFVKKASGLAQDNYPEGLYAAYIINAPKIFSMIWAVVKQFLDPKTVAKVHIYGPGDKMWNKLQSRLGDGVTLRKEMVCCSKEDIGKAEAEAGLICAHSQTQRWIRDRVAGKEPDVGATPGVLRRESSIKDVYDYFFDASEDLGENESPSLISGSFKERSVAASQPGVEVVNAGKSKKKGCKCC